MNNEKRYPFRLKVLISAAWVISRESQKINWSEGKAGDFSFSNAGQSPTAFTLLLEKEEIRGTTLGGIV